MSAMFVVGGVLFLVGSALFVLGAIISASASRVEKKGGG